MRQSARDYGILLVGEQRYVFEDHYKKGVPRYTREIAEGSEPALDRENKQSLSGLQAPSAKTPGLLFLWRNASYTEDSSQNSLLSPERSVCGLLSFLSNAGSAFLNSPW